MTIQTVILAAGLGRRMYSDLPKVLHRLSDKSLLEHVICTSLTLSPSVAPLIVYGHHGKIVKAHLEHFHVRWVEQKEQLGTGHALLQALAHVDPDSQILVLYGDVPLILCETLKKLIIATPKKSIGLLTAFLPNPTGYGRIVRDKKNNIKGIVEEKDATTKEKLITEINPGIYLAPAKYLKKWLPTLKNNNAQGEYYLTDIIAKAVKEKISICSVQPEVNEEILGINDKVQLANLERFYQKQLAEKLMRQGVTLLDPARLDIRGNVQVGSDTIIDVNVILEGNVVIGKHCIIGPNVILKNVSLADHVEVKANCVLDGAEIASDSIIGPFARLRPGTVLAEKVHIGNFVEIKQSDIGQGSKVNHLSYIGNSEVGKQVNIGAGTITCNYDGVNKHKTIIGDHVQIGSDTQLVAPVTIGSGATIGAGSTIIKDAPPQQLTLTHRLEQRSLTSWDRPKKCEELEKN